MGPATKVQPCPLAKCLTLCACHVSSNSKRQALYMFPVELDAGTANTNTNVNVNVNVNVNKKMKMKMKQHVQCVSSLKTLTPHITCLALHGKLLYAASLNLINVFEFEHSSDYSHIDAFNQSPSSGFVKSITFRGSTVFTAHQDCKIRVWFITPQKRHRLLSSLPTLHDRLRRCILPRNYVTLRRHKTALWIHHSDTVSALTVRHTLMYSVSWDKTLKVWDLFTHRCLESVAAHHDAVNALAVAHDGTVYTASADGSIRVWRRGRGGAKGHALVSHVEGRHQKSTVNALVLEGDGTALFSGGCDGAIRRWEWGENDDVAKVETLRGHGGAILCLVHVAGLLASASADLTVRIWRGSDGGGGYCCMAVLEGHQKPVKSLVAFSGERESSNGVVTLLSGSLDGEIKIWELFGFV